MSTKRQPEFGRRSFAVTTRMTSMMPPQSAEWAQLIYATKGSLTVESPIGERLWYVPARPALWIPAGVASSLRLRGTVRIRMIYLHKALCTEAPETQAINVAPLLHESILEAVRRSVLSPDEPLTQLIIELLLASSSAPLMLPMPQDARALRVAKELIHDPGLEVRWKGHLLPYRVFSKHQRVSHAAIVDNKRLGHALANRGSKAGNQDTEQQAISTFK